MKYLNKFKCVLLLYQLKFLAVQAQSDSELPLLASAKEAESWECRTCLDDYRDSFFCMGLNKQGYCCPFIDSSVGISRYEPLQCSHSPTFG